jgi:hypothetical protein
MHFMRRSFSLKNVMFLRVHKMVVDMYNLLKAEVLIVGRSSTTFSAQLTACLRDLARHFKTDPTETVALCFGYPKTPCLQAAIDTVSRQLAR